MEAKPDPLIARSETFKQFGIKFDFLSKKYDMQL